MSESRRNSQLVSGSAVLAGGIASATAAAITSKFGVGGTIGGAAITSMIVIAVSSIVKAHLETAQSKVRQLGSGLQTRNLKKGGFNPLRNLASLGEALRWFSLMPGYRRKAILVRVLLAAALTFVVGLAIITATEASFGKSLSCKIWGNCPVVTTANGATEKATSTGLSIFGGGAKATNSGPVTSSGTSSAPAVQRNPSSAAPSGGTPSNVQSAPANGSQNNAAQPSGGNQQSAPAGGVQQPSGGNQQSAPAGGAQQPSGGNQQSAPSGGQVPSQQQAAPGGQGAVQRAVPAGAVAGGNQ
ncbi:hypothetical protein [Rubrobacter calidifluminis]|uniref:hypothetical protein n=1 Tax=Rubrobacter calidifluminis TaxID=1392640 RepID=UPI0023604525|nr:hypothetical protein [Rubrobacter calidifluminis]